VAARAERHERSYRLRPGEGVGEGYAGSPAAGSTSRATSSMDPAHRGRSRADRSGAGDARRRPAYGSPHGRGTLSLLAGRGRAELQREALKRGRRLYARQPRKVAKLVRRAPAP
jgi:hypothetical protein